MAQRSFRISSLAKRHGLSRSTLLYYDRVGLLKPSGRTQAGYRIYTDEDDQRLRTIRRYREFGLAVDEIIALLGQPVDGLVTALERQFDRLSARIHQLKNQQKLIIGFLMGQRTSPRAITSRAAWIAGLAKLGFDEAQMMAWHAEFERLAPEAHDAFLAQIGVPADERTAVRQAAAAWFAVARHAVPETARD